jgi:uncharacterized protein (DUF433 family)
MSSAPKTIRMPDDIREPIEAEARLARRDFSSVANEMLLEAIKMRRIPGILFANSPAGGRVARIAGTGLEVFELVQAYRAMENSWARLRESFHWLSDTQLRAALAYSEAYPEEIEERIRREEAWTPEATWQKYPFMSPKGR